MSEHGTASCYDYRKCRCDLCRQAASNRKMAYDTLNRERNAAYSRAWRKANRERKAVTDGAWKQANLVKQRGYEAKSRARRATDKTGNGVFTVTEQDWLRLCARYDNACAYCGTKAKLTRDHVIPLVRGGRHSIGNLIPACGPCNSSKNKKFLVEWRHVSAAVGRAS